VAIFIESEVVRVYLFTKAEERRSPLSVFETFLAILDFDTFIIVLIVELLKTTEITAKL